MTVFVSGQAVSAELLDLPVRPVPPFTASFYQRERYLQMLTVVRRRRQRFIAAITVHIGVAHLRRSQLYK